MGAENGGMIVDISEDGLGFQAVGRVEKGAEIAVSFSLGAGYRISAHARIAWVGANGNSGGTTFTRLPADSRSIIREWVTKTAEAEAAREASAAVEAEITAPETGAEETPLIIERFESPRAPLSVPALPEKLVPETFVAAEPSIEPAKPLAPEAIQPEIPAVETLAAQPDISPTVISPPIIPQDVQPNVTATAEPLVPSVVPPIERLAAESVAEPLIEQALQQNLEPLLSENVQHDVTPAAPDNVQQDVQTDVQASIEPVLHTQIQSNLQAERDAPFAMQAETRKEPVASPADTSPAGTGRADISAGDASSADASSAGSIPPEISVSPGMPPETPAPSASKLSAQAPENRPKTRQVPSAPPRTELPRPLFPPRNTGELFSRSPWISGQSVPEEERSHKGLIAVIIICLIVAASVASVPYLRSHRQQIGARIEGMGRSVAGEPVQNASAPSQQPSQQTSQPSPQTRAPHSGTPSSSGGAISAKPSSVATKPPRVTAPSASATAPATQLHPSVPPADAGSGAAIQNRPVSPALSAIPPAAGSTGLLAPAGQTEFRQAQKYLNGTGSVAADPAEAAELFWRSLEKGNTAAAIPLADLYLQGKGVSRSCLQARILLTAASNKGNADAVEKLHQLPENCE